MPDPAHTPAERMENDITRTAEAVLANCPDLLKGLSACPLCVRAAEMLDAYAALREASSRAVEGQGRAQEGAAMTALQFERAYARRSDVDIWRLRRSRTVRPCCCEYESCEGWQSISYRSAWEHSWFYGWSRWRLLGDAWRKIGALLFSRRPSRKGRA